MWPRINVVYGHEVCDKLTDPDEGHRLKCVGYIRKLFTIILRVAADLVLLTASSLCALCKQTKSCQNSYLSFTTFVRVAQAETTLQHFGALFCQAGGDLYPGNSDSLCINGSFHHPSCAIGLQLQSDYCYLVSKLTLNYRTGRNKAD